MPQYRFFSSTFFSRFKIGGYSPVYYTVDFQEYLNTHVSVFPIPVCHALQILHAILQPCVIWRQDLLAITQTADVYPNFIYTRERTLFNWIVEVAYPWLLGSYIAASRLRKLSRKYSPIAQDKIEELLPSFYSSYRAHGPAECIRTSSSCLTASG